MKDALFGEWGRGVVELEQPRPQSTVPEFQGAAGGTSDFINYHAAPTLTVNCRNQYFDTMKAGEDAVSGSEGVYGMSGGYFDPQALTPQQQASMRAAAHLTEGVAGISTFATVMNEEIAQRPDHRWRRGTPHQQEEMHSFLCPSNEHLNSYHAAARNAHAEQVDESGVAGTRAHRITINAERGTPPRRAKSGLGGGHGRESGGWSGGGELAGDHPPRGEERDRAAAEHADRAAAADRPAGSRYSAQQQLVHNGSLHPTPYPLPPPPTPHPKP